MKSATASRYLAAVLLTAGLAGLSVPSSSAAGIRPRLHLAASTPSYTLFGWNGRDVSVPVVLSGAFSGAPKGARAQLLSRTFPFTGNELPGRIETLVVANDGSAPFSFSVQPEGATQYFVHLLGPDGSLDNSFELRTVYVTSRWSLEPLAFDCRAATCHASLRLLRFLPAGVRKYELTKPYYDYLGVSFAKRSLPPAPRYLYLQHSWTTSHTSAVPHVAGEFETTFRYSFRLDEPHYRYTSYACTVDSEAKDGFGLPGRNLCGAAKVPANEGYLG
ncbi:MAG: hypothetical protein ACYCST_00390 [Acidimicrobiales bacterium]